MKQVPIDQQLSAFKHSILYKKGASSKVEQRCAVIVCRRQGITLRGHRDDSKHLKESPQDNHGNFVALLNFRVQNGDDVLTEQLQSNSHSQNVSTSAKPRKTKLVMCAVT